MIVLTARLQNVVIDVPFALIDVVKTSDGTNQATGPIPAAKLTMYNERPRIATQDVALDDVEPLSPPSPC